MFYVIYSPTARPEVENVIAQMPDQDKFLLAPIGLQAGSEEWQVVVEHDMEACSAALAILTPVSLQDQSVIWRIEKAIDKQLMIVPVVSGIDMASFEEAPAPLKKMLYYQWMPVDLTGPDAVQSLSRLIGNLEASIEQLRPAKCFISYSRTDTDFAKRLARDLRNTGLDTWRDAENIPAGANWDREIEKAIRECTHIVFIATPESVASENVQDEIGLGINLGKAVIPAMLETCNLPLRVYRAQWVDFRENYEPALQKLCLQLGVEISSEGVYKPHLDLIFDDAHERMAQLASSNGGAFTNQEFVKSVMKDRSIEYIDLLVSVIEHFKATKGEDYARE